MEPPDDAPLAFAAAVSPADVAAAYALIDAAARDLLAEFGFIHWLFPGKSPALVARLAAAPDTAVFLARDALGAPLATFTLARAPLSTYYDAAAWAEPGAPAAYLGNLAVAPARTRAGLGARALAAAAREAAARFGARFLRCDAVAEHPRLARFYARGGFVARGTPPRLGIKNPFAGGAAEAAAAPGAPPYAAAAARPPPADATVYVTCQAFELAIGVQ